MTQSEILDKITTDLILEFQNKVLPINGTVAKIRELHYKYWNNWWEADIEFENYIKIYYPQYYEELKK